MELIKEIDAEGDTKNGETLETRVRNNFYKSQLYNLDRNKFRVIKSLFVTIVDVALTLSGLLPYMYDMSKDIAVIIFDWNNR